MKRVAGVQRACNACEECSTREDQSHNTNDAAIFPINICHYEYVRHTVE